MRRLSDTVERLSRYRRAPINSTVSRLKRLENRGQNPGDLVGWYSVPEKPPSPPALVVVLHGCTQDAAGYDAGSGWSKLADEFGFAVLYPEQSRQNNPNLCFNWFVESNTKRGHGEVHSVREMVDTMVSGHGIDPQRVFVTGLSAGGAMANAMLVSYPEVFAGGAIIAGIPYGAASTIPQAFDRMRGHGLPPSEVLQATLRSASAHQGRWPLLSVWHGTADRTVDEANALALIEQWRAVHNVAEQPTKRDVTGRLENLTWVDPAGREVIELHRIDRMEHGTPIDSGAGYGTAGPYMLDVGISSTEYIARSWGLTPSFERRATANGRLMANTPAEAGPLTSGLQCIIEDALRAAGLMK